MSEYILIVLLTTGVYDGDGSSIAMQDFNNKPRCEYARAIIEQANTSNRVNIRVLRCVKK